MSMLSIQIAELRDKARLFEGYQNGEISDLLRDAADTIEILRERLQDDALGAGECEMLKHMFMPMWTCTSCGKTNGGIYGAVEYEPPKVCPNCGKAVKR